MQRYLIKTLAIISLYLPFMSFAEETNGNNGNMLDSSIQQKNIAPEAELSETSQLEGVPSPWSASLFYLYNVNTKKMLLVPTPGYEKGGFKANAQSASYTFNKVYDFESSVSTNWSIGQDDDANDKLIFKVNASIKRRVAIAVPFLQLSQGVSFNKSYSQISLGASSFVPTPWFFILPRYTATFNNSDMNQFEYGVEQSGWSTGWGVTALKPINENWTLLAIYNQKILEKKLRTDDVSNKSLMMVLSYSF